MQSRWSLTLVWLAWSLCAAGQTTPADTPGRLLGEASRDAAEGRYAAAKAGIEASLALDPGRGETWYQMGLLDGQMGDYRGAEEAFRRALRLDPNAARVHCRLGQTLVAEPGVKEDWPGAVAEFKAALALDPNYAEAESLLGLGLMHLGDLQAAIATLRHAIEAHPAMAAAHLDLALALDQEQDAEGAVKEYRAALALKPDAPDTEASLGSLLLRLGRTAEAEQPFRSALKQNPDLQQAHYGLARVLKANRRMAEAAAELELAAELEHRKPDQDQATRLNNEALQLASKGDLAAAIAGLRQAVVLKPDYGVAKYNLGLMLADAGDLAAARGQLVLAVSLLPERATVWFDLGRVLARLGDRQGAMEAVGWATRLAPSNARFAEELKQIVAGLSTGGTLTEVFANGVAGAPGAGPPRFGASADTAAERLVFARQLRARGDAAGALGELLRALVLEPGSMAARMELAQVYGSLSLWSRAVEENRKVLLVAGEEDIGAELALAGALLKAGNGQEAERRYEAVLRMAPHSEAALAGLKQVRRLSGHS